MPPKPATGKGPSNPRGAGQALQAAQSSSSDAPQQESGAEGQQKRRRKRGGKKNKPRRQSFAAPPETEQPAEPLAERPNLETVAEGQQHSSFYNIGNRAASDSSLESEALLDHREQNKNPLRPRRQSLLNSSQGASRPSQTQSMLTQQMPSRYSQEPSNYYDDREEQEETSDRTPLIHHQRPSRSQSGYGGLGSSHGGRSGRRQSNTSSISTRKRIPRQMSVQSIPNEYDINNPPSVPGSPILDAGEGFDDVMLPEYNSPDDRHRPVTGEAVIDIDQSRGVASSPGGPNMRRRGTATGASPVEDVCLPFEQMTEIGEEEEDYMHQQNGGAERPRRRHRKEWPDISVLEDWSREEKEERTMEGVRAKKVDEPVLIGGRLRPQRGGWSREDEEAPFRWTYFNEELDSSLRSHTVSGLQQLGHSFRELFRPDPPEIIDDSSSSEDEEEDLLGPERSATPNGNTSRAGTRQSSILDHSGFDPKQQRSSQPTPTHADRSSRPKKFGPPPIFWLDVLEPTWDEMRVLSRAFGIHKLTAEDIMEQEAREKVELFRNYYFVNYRTFEQDQKSEDHMDPVNMYFVVFKGGVISFHFSQMPHPPNVRRRIRQLAEHQYTDSDWIAYAIIDNITDAYAPLIEQIEQEVDDIDDEILMLHHNLSDEKKGGKSGKQKSISNPPHERGHGDEDAPTPPDTRRDMLLRVGECRKRVMGLYRLLGNKADVIKGLAKRCNEQWQVAPRSDVGLYLGDIQDHVVTMTGNLSHYESILSRAHSNYLAQINIGMNERAEQTNDVLGRLTVLGTIVLPMNIVTGMWGMNCLVPGQVEDNPTLYWFFGLTTFLLLFGFSSFFVAKKVYNIV